MKHIPQIALTVLLLAALGLAALGVAVADGAPAGGRPPVSVELEWIVELCRLDGVLHGLGDEVLVVKIEAFGTTHHLVVDPRDPWVAPGQDVCLEDWYLRPEHEGEQAVGVEVRARGKDPARDRDRVLLKTTVTVDVRKMDDEKFEEDLDDARRLLTGGSVQGDWEFYANAVVHSKDGKWVGRPLSENGRAYQDACHTFFMDRVQAYAHLARTFEARMRPGDAQRALKEAQDIFQEEREVVVATPHNPGLPLAREPDYFTRAPGHFEGYVHFYGKSGDMDNAFAWLQEMHKWYDDERQRGDLLPEDRVDAQDYLASAYRKAAHLSILINQDWEQYDIGMKKFDELLSEGARKSVPYWASGVSRTAAGGMLW